MNLPPALTRSLKTVVCICAASACGQLPPANRNSVPHPGIAADVLKIDATVTTKCSDDGVTLAGIDVSTYQGTNIDWQRVADAGKTFAIAKVSEGTSIADDAFSTNWSGIAAAGMIRGAYHFFHPSDDPTAQAKFMLQNIAAAGGLQSGDLPPVIDVEVSDGLSGAEVVTSLNEMINAIEERSGLVPIVYTAPYFWQDTLGDPGTDATLWTAVWNTQCPEIPDAFSDWAFWQTADTGSVPSIAGDVDLDVFNGDLPTLYALTAP